jgi:hypothetical protein
MLYIGHISPDCPERNRHAPLAVPTPSPKELLGSTVNVHVPRSDIGDLRTSICRAIRCIQQPFCRNVRGEVTGNSHEETYRVFACVKEYKGELLGNVMQGVFAVSAQECGGGLLAVVAQEYGGVYTAIVASKVGNCSKLVFLKNLLIALLIFLLSTKTGLLIHDEQ